MPNIIVHMLHWNSWVQLIVTETPDRRNSKRVCHVNLLKQYHERDARLFSTVLMSWVLTVTEISTAILICSKQRCYPSEKTTSLTNKIQNLTSCLLSLTIFSQINQERLIWYSITLNWLQELRLADLPHTGRVQIKWICENRNFHFEGARNCEGCS